MKVNRSIAVVYENALARQRAVEFCDDLIKRVWSQDTFDVGWWSFSELEETEAARKASETASEAEVVIFAVHSDGELSPEVTAWIESWLQQRGDREGALVGLTESGAEKSPKHIYLRGVAHRGCMDYLTEMPCSTVESIPDSLEYCAERARQVTGVLQEILAHQQSSRNRLQL
jgi:hypothetical protein